MNYIKKLKLFNFKRFQTLSLDFDNQLNILIGDNEAGKSTILSALDIVLSGSRSKIEAIGLDNLFNTNIIQLFLQSKKQFVDLPYLVVEVYLNEQKNCFLNGSNNSDDLVCDGLRLCVEPSEELSEQIHDILEVDDPNFPFEYYSIHFQTFAGKDYSGYRKYIRHVLIDTSQISNEYAARAFVRDMYNTHASDAEKSKHQNEYRRYKDNYRNNVLNEVNKRTGGYSFTIKTGSHANLETDLTISEDDINIENRGKGRQCFLKTEAALHKNKTEKSLDVVLFEEPENHLSHLNMKKLINNIRLTQDKQVFIATHSNQISTRLDLRKTILFNSCSYQPMTLNHINIETAKYFMKASNNSLLEYILSKKVILVEGDAEFILMEIFFKKVTGEELEESDIHVISVGGTSFKRFLDIALKLNIRTAVVRDNDRCYENNCVDNFASYLSSPDINVFSERNNDIYTFEVALYRENTTICDELFGANRRTLSVLNYMLQNKADAAFEILSKKSDEMQPPSYIRDAIVWIKG